MNAHQRRLQKRRTIGFDLETYDAPTSALLQLAALGTGSTAGVINWEPKQYQKEMIERMKSVGARATPFPAARTVLVSTPTGRHQNVRGKSLVQGVVERLAELREYEEAGIPPINPLTGAPYFKPVDGWGEGWTAVPIPIDPKTGLPADAKVIPFKVAFSSLPENCKD